MATESPQPDSSDKFVAIKAALKGLGAVLLFLLVVGLGAFSGCVGGALLGDFLVGRVASLAKTAEGGLEAVIYFAIGGALAGGIGVAVWWGLCARKRRDQGGKS